MDDHTQEVITNALQLRKFESWPESHVRRAIEAARCCDSTKARVEIEALERLLPKAHRVSA
jgi:hypothetical protein